MHCLSSFFFFQAEDGIRDLVRSRGLGDVYKRQAQGHHPGPGSLLPLCNGKTARVAGRGQRAVEFRAGEGQGEHGADVVLSLIHI